MTYTYNIIQDMIDLINNEILFTIVSEAIRGYGKANLPIPLAKTYLSFVPEETKITYFQNEDAHNCIQNHITVRINLFAPRSRLPEQTQALAEAVLEYLSSAYLENITGYEIGDLDYDSEVKAYRLPTKLYLYYESCPLDDEATNKMIHVPESFFCKHHVNDATAHLTAEQHDFVSNPFVTGVYKGTGSEVTVNLGFKPSALIVFRYGSSPCIYNHSTGKTDNYVSFSFAGRYNYGLAPTDTGFKASQYEGNGTNNYMSVNGGYYAYFAFK